MTKFFVVGDVTVDQMYFVDNLPESGEEVAARRSVMEPGGAGGTISTALARLGNDVLLAARVGKGPFGELALQHVKEAGVDISLVQIDPTLQTSSITLLITPNARRTMISGSGSSRHLDATFLREKHIAACDALIINAYSLLGGPQREYAIRALGYAQKNRLTTFIDMGSGAAIALGKRLLSVIQDVDYLLMNRRELLALTGENSISEAVSGLAEQGFKRVLVKLGEMGSMIITPEISELVEAHEVDGVLESTGAGDYFTAAFAHGVMQGYDLHYAAKLGNIAGALNVTTIGAQSFILSEAQLEALAEGAHQDPLNAAKNMTSRR